LSDLINPSCELFINGLNIDFGETHGVTWEDAEKKMRKSPEKRARYTPGWKRERIGVD